MADVPSFGNLMDRLRARDEAAAAELFQRFAVRLGLLAGQRLGPLARGKVDGEDVVQSVFKSFFQRHRQGLLTPDGWGGLWALLTTITLNKCGHHLAYLVAARRDVRREAAPLPDFADPSWHALATDPTPSQGAILRETVEQLLDGLESEHRTIVQLALEGHTPAEIARQVDLTERTVQRVLKRVRETLEGQAAGEDGRM